MSQIRIDNIHKALTAQELDAVVVSSAENIRYLSGFTGDSTLLMITLHQAYLLTDFRYLEQAEQESPDFTVAEPAGGLVETLADVAAKTDVKKLGFEAEHITYQQLKVFEEKLSGIDLLPTVDLIETERQRKDDGEIANLRKAVEIADQAFEKVLPLLKPGVTEREIAAELEYIMKKNGAEKPAFDFIIASGPRSALPHGSASDKKLLPGEFVTLDYGAVYKGYHSDMTRTVVLGKASEEQRKLYDIVLEAQLQGIQQVNAGVVCAEVDRAARDIIKGYGYGENFGHGLGHSVGLAIHEKPNFSFRDQTVLTPGMALTVEPGIYLKGWGGVRIEDIVLVTDAGCEVLTTTTKKLLEV